MKTKPRPKLRKFAFVAFFLAVASADAVAGGGGGIVFDPTNFAENIQTAISTVASESLALESKIREIEMLANSVKNTTNTIQGLNGIGNLGASLQALTQQWNVDNTLMTQLGGEQNFVGNVMAQYGASNTGSFSTFVSQQAGQVALGQQNATSLFANYTNMTNEMNKTMQQRQAIAAKNTGALGTNDAIQATNASLDNLAEINQATLQGISTLVRQEAYKQSQQTGGDSSRNNNLTSYYNQLQTDSAAQTNTAAPASIMGY